MLKLATDCAQMGGNNSIDSKEPVVIKSHLLQEQNQNSPPEPQRRIPPSDVDPSETNESLTEHSTSLDFCGALVPNIQRQMPSGDESDSEKNDDEEEVVGDSKQLDEFGFSVDDNYEPEMEHMERMMKWKEMTDDWDLWVRKKHKRLKERVRKGIPNAYRTVVWAKLLKSDVYKQHCNKHRKDYYKWLVTKQKPAHDALTVIQNDLDRTFPRHALFRNRKGDGQNQLYRVLYAYACHDQEVGYCQGMGFLAALFLMYYTEEDAFYCLLSLLNNPKYSMRGLFTPGLPLLHERFFQFEYLLKRYFPALAAKFEEHNITAQFYGSNWFMTIFLYHCDDFATTARIWDAYLSEGYKVVFRIGLAIMKAKSKELSRLDDYESLMKAVQRFGTQIPRDVIKDAFAISLSRKDLKKASAEYRRKTSARE